MNIYHCKHCGRFYDRDSGKVWVRSWCEDANRSVHLMRLDKAGLTDLERALHSATNSTEGAE